MRVSRHYIDAVLESGNELSLPKDISHYLCNVLRLQDGAELSLFNGSQGEHLARIIQASKNACRVELGEQIFTQTQPKLRLELGLGLSRGDRMDYGIQKSTELGVSSITPIYAERGEVRIKQPARLENKLRHWQKVAIGACEQSGRLDIPEISTPLTVSEWLDSRSCQLNLVLDPRARESVAGLAACDSISLLSGPEGGFTESELAAAEAKGFSAMKLGPRILRTETAPVAALAILQHRFGDM